MINFKMSWYKDEYGNKARIWEVYVDGAKNDLQICHICKKYYNEMYGNSDGFVKNSMESYAVGAYDGWSDDYVGDFKTLAEAKQAVIDNIRG